MRALVLVLLVAVLCAAPSPGSGELTTARAQVWKPETRKKKAPPRRHRRRKKKKPAAKKPARPPATAKPAESPPEDEPPEEVIDAAGDDDSGDAEPPEEVIGDDDDGGGETVRIGGDDDDGDGGETVRIGGDDLDDVGADVTFTESDLATNETGNGKGTTELDTLAMAYLRMGIDTVQDPVPLAPTGVKAVGEDVLTFRLHGRASGIGRFGKRIKIKVAGRADADLGLDADTHRTVERYEAEVWDTYADLYTSWLDLRFGKQVIAWGEADMLSPNDVVNARDLRRGFLDRPDELRLPVLALTAKAYDGPFSIEGLYIPVAPINRFELLEGDYALLGPNAATPVERRIGAIVSSLLDDPMLGPQLRPFVDIAQSPDNGIESGELGGSVAFNFRRVDLALYGIWMHERSARIELHPDLRQALVDTPPDMYTPDGVANAIGMVQMAGAVPVSVSYPRKLHFGGAIAGRIEPVGIKVDVGYDVDAVANLVPPGGGPLLAQPRTSPLLGAALSIDYDRGSALTAVLEAAHYRFLDIPDALDVYQYQHDRLTLVAGRLEWNPKNGPVTLRFLGLVDVGSPSYALRPAIRLSGHDNLSVEIAAALYGGPQGSYGGVADRNDEIILTFQYGL